MSESVVVVTGALTGIGAATASAFAHQGDVVVVSGRHDDVGERLARDLKRAGAVDSFSVHADVRFEREVAELISAAVKSFGRLDVAVNNAGTKGLGAHRRADRNAVRGNVRLQRAGNAAVDET